MRKIPEFIPIEAHLFEEFGLPFRPGTVYQHRSRGGRLKRYTIKDPHRADSLCLRRYLGDLRQAEKQNFNREASHVEHQP